MTRPAVTSPIFRIRFSKASFDRAMLTREFLSSLAGCQLLTGSVSGPAWAIWIARLGVPIAGILIPLGFFLSVASPKATTPGSFIYSAYVGVAALGASVLSLGILLIRSAIS